MKTLEELRGEIDSLDRQIADLLCARMEVSAQVAEYKKQNHGAVLAPEREQALLEKVGGLCPPEYKDGVQNIYRTVLSESRKVQKKLGCGIYGLLGCKLGHSFSPVLHKMLSGCDYGLFDLEEDKVGGFLKSGAFDGLNVTIPYKKAVIPYLDELTDRARRIGSVNTIVRRADGTLLGHNTDYDGFLYQLRSLGVDVRGKKAVVLGSGGASLTVRTVLQDRGVGEIVVISRSGPDNYRNLERHGDAEILVNTTPVGMYPDSGSAPVSLDAFPKLEAVFDLHYNPARTELMLHAAERGIPCRGGLGMLVAQARAASELFMERKLPENCVAELEGRLRKEKQNILLVGMPGSGKTSVGRVLAEKLGRPFLDTDQLIEQQAGMSIPELFRLRGEEEFRVLESAVIEKEAGNSGCVISVGGGAVTVPGNCHPMQRNSLVVFLERPTEELAIGGRPLSEKIGVEELYRRRLPLYEKLADLRVDNTGIEETADEIVRRIGQ